MRLSVNYSQALVTLIRTGVASVDAIEWVDVLSPEFILQTKDSLTGVDHHFHPGRMRFSESGVAHLKNYLAQCPQTEHVSIHLAPLPDWVTLPALRWQVYLPETDPEGQTRRFVKRVKSLKTQVDPPIILENMPALHPSKYRFESEPAVITHILEATDCSLLLDLAHARIAAEARGVTTEAYLSQLPLERVVQLHLTGTRVDTRSGRLFDAHQSLEPADYSLLEWTLARSQPRWLTLEFFREEPDLLLTQVNRLGEYCQS